MVFKEKIPPETVAYARYLRLEIKMSLRKVAKKTGMSASSVRRKCRSTRRQKGDPKSRKTTTKRLGRPRKISEAQERYIIRELHKLRLNEGTFSIARLMVAAGLDKSKITERSVLNVLHRNGYRFRQTRKKGLLSPKDLKGRVRFAKKMAKRPAEFWCNGVSFYLDAVSFVYKTNPHDQAKAPGSRVFRKRTEGLIRGCTTRGKKEGTGGKYVKLIVAITHGKGILICKPYEKMDGACFASFIENEFPDMFHRADKDTDLFVQDGDPSQNSRKAKDAMERCSAQLLSIPPRSPDINPIENIFHLVSKKMKADALEQRLTVETYDEFQRRAILTIHSIPKQTIDKTIASSRDRLLAIIENGGERTKY